MKKFAGLVIILVALVLGGYYGMGVLTEKTVKKNLDVLNQSNGFPIRFFAEVEQYHKGLFNSKAKIKWRMHVPERTVRDANGQSQTVSAQDFMVEMPLIIQHGPIIITPNSLRFGLGYAEATFPFPAQYKEQFEAMFSKASVKPQLNLSIFVNYLNESTIDFSIPAFNLLAKDNNGHFEWMGMKAITIISSGMKKVDGQIIIDGIHASKDDSQFNLAKVLSEYNLHKTASGLYLGDAQFTLPAVNLFVKNEKVFELADLDVKSNSDIQEHLFNTHFSAVLQSMLANGKNYGPGDIDFALKNLDADVLARINQQAAAMQNGSNIQRQQAMFAMLPELPKLFARGAEFKVSKLNFKIPQGQIEADLFISLPDGKNVNSFELLQKIQGNAKLKVPGAVVKQILEQSLMQKLANQPELQQTLTKEIQGTEAPGALLSIEQLAAIQADKQLSALQKSGLIVVQATDYLVEVSFEKGTFTVNGKPFDSSMMKF